MNNKKHQPIVHLHLYESIIEQGNLKRNQISIKADLESENHNKPFQLEK